VTQASVSVSPKDPACRDYTAQAIIDGRTQPLVGHACQQPDGSWRIAEGTPEQPSRFVAVYPAPTYPAPTYPAPAYPAYAYDPWCTYDPWFWGPPIGLSIGSFVFVDRVHRFHDFGRFHHHFAFAGFAHHGFSRGGFSHGGFEHGGMHHGR
jgi:surface antigen